MTLFHLSASPFNPVWGGAMRGRRCLLATLKAKGTQPC
jgi:hypothetical protein